MPPEPADPWIGTFDATQDAVRCAQTFNADNGTAHAIGKEDCLVINVSTADLAGSSPVIVSIH